MVECVCDCDIIYSKFLSDFGFEKIFHFRFECVVILCSICRKSSWTRNCASVDSSFDMDAVVCVASEFMLLVFVDLVLFFVEVGERV